LVRNLRIFVIRLSVCPWQAFPALSNKHSSLVPKLVNYRQKGLKSLEQAGKASQEQMFSNFFVLSVGDKEKSFITLTPDER
jgi:hypothetical protein